jgi:glycosyltransferase involved in cell wall biosynthesis
VKLLSRNAVLVQVSDFGLGRGLFVSRALALLGLDVTVITNKPVYQKNASRLNPGPGVTIDEFDIPLARFLYSSVLGRLLFYVAFTSLAFLRLARAKASVLYSRGPQPFTEVACLAYKSLFPGTIVISDTTDLWPDSLQFLKMNHVLKTALMRVGFTISQIVYKDIDAVVTHNELMARILSRRFHRPTEVVRGVVDLDMFRAGKPLSEGVQSPSQKLTVLYAGLLGQFQNPMALVEVASRLKDEITLVVAGRGPLQKDVLKAARNRGLQNMVFAGTRPFEMMPQLYAESDICLLTYADLPFLKIGLPKKFIEYAASGKPVLFLSPPCAASEICLAWDAGYRVDANDFDRASDKLRELANNRNQIEAMGENAGRMAQALFSIEGASKTIGAMISRLGTDRRGVPN